MKIRDASPADHPFVMEIYHDEVLNGVGTFDLEPLSDEKQRAWLAPHTASRYPLTVAEEGGRIAGWGSLKPWSDRRAYARSAEISVYVHRDCRGRGVARSLLMDLLERAREGGIVVLIARIAAENKASRALFGRAGFQSIGMMRRVGEKFGRVLDVELLDLHLDS
ncbi:MAG: N-acetyltransferase family protein [Deltaproteobacteria bacterium]|nr:N-acetyltransferase family protein [Deltaproteobacteria bacterium]